MKNSAFALEVSGSTVPYHTLCLSHYLLFRCLAQICCSFKDNKQVTALGNHGAPLPTKLTVCSEAWCACAQCCVRERMLGTFKCGVAKLPGVQCCVHERMVEQRSVRMCRCKAARCAALCARTYVGNLQVCRCKAALPPIGAWAICQAVQ